MKFRNSFFVISCVILFCQFYLFCHPATAKLKNFSQIAPGIFRGSHPLENDDFEELKYNNIKTILNLEWMIWNKNKVEKASIQHGFNYKAVPMNPLTLSQDKIGRKLTRALHIMTDPTQQPVYVNCMLGKDRTGFAIAMYKIHIENKKWPQVYEEMREYGFKPLVVFGYKKFFESHNTPGSFDLSTIYPSPDQFDFM